MRYCKNCKWLGTSLYADGLCLRLVPSRVYGEKQLREDAAIERGSRGPGNDDACGKDAQYWEEYIPPKTWWQRLWPAALSGE